MGRRNSGKVIGARVVKVMIVPFMMVLSHVGIGQFSSRWIRIVVHMGMEVGLSMIWNPVRTRVRSSCFLEPFQIRWFWCCDRILTRKRDCKIYKHTQWNIIKWDRGSCKDAQLVFSRETIWIATYSLENMKIHLYSQPDVHCKFVPTHSCTRSFFDANWWRQREWKTGNKVFTRLRRQQQWCPLLHSILRAINT